MRKWECVVCGLIYDEALGWPDDGIEPGTAWEDVPEDWLCPDCGVGKEDFELMESAAAEDTPEAAASESTAPLVILGTGLAGYGLAKEIRKLDQDIPLVLITSDDGAAYSKPMLSTGFTKGTSAAELVQSDASTMAATLNARILTRTVVSRVDAAAQTVTLEGGGSKTLEYSKLVLAVGAGVISPPLGGDGGDSVFSINSLEDYATFRQALENSQAKDICVIGAGLIGCEYSNDLLNGGYRVQAVDALSTCLPTLLPKPAGDAVRRGLEDAGAVFHFGTTVEAVHRRGDGVTVSLANGNSLEADIVVSAIGVRPNLDLAISTGLTTNRGICTDRLLQTSELNIYAMGDCAEVDGLVLVYVAPLMAQARALARTLTGSDTAVDYPAMPVSVKVPACPTVVSPPARDASGEWMITEDGIDVKAEFRNAEGALLGFALTGSFTSEKRQLQQELPDMFPDRH